MMTRVKVIDRLSARYRRWNRLAYPSRSESRLNRTLWGLLVVDVAYALAHHIWLLNKPAFVSWGPAATDASSCRQPTRTGQT